MKINVQKWFMSSKKMQDYNFRDVTDFLDFLPEKELNICLSLRELIFECIPDVSERLSYNVPYFRRIKNICFIWPGIIKWGKNQSYEGVRLGFTQGHLMADEYNFLVRGSRKQVYWHDFLSLKELDHDLLRSYLYEAAAVDESFMKI